MSGGLFETDTHTGIALCLSGGGYRAMLFHTGVLWRLYEFDYLRRLSRISSVSGGSIVAGVLGMQWSNLGFDPARVHHDFVGKVVTPIRLLAGSTIDVPAILMGLLWFGTVSSRMTKQYRKRLFGGTTLQSLPDAPRFVINATNVQSGALWRFSKPYMRDYRVGEVRNPTVSLAAAVAASSAFPPFLSPARLDLDPAAFTANSGTDLQREPFTRRPVLTDGGVYDNLGLETASAFETLLVSDGGGKTAAQARPTRLWTGHSYRVLDLVDNQVRSLRKRDLIAAYRSGARRGAFWGIRTNLADYGLTDALPCSHAATIALAEVKTRLKRLNGVTQERLINWGYAACDAAMRKHVDPSLSPPTGFPYPAAGVG